MLGSSLELFKIFNAMLVKWAHSKIFYSLNWVAASQWCSQTDTKDGAHSEAWIIEANVWLFLFNSVYFVKTRVLWKAKWIEKRKKNPSEAK